MNQQDFQDGMIRTSHSTQGKYPSCYHSHPALKIGKYLIYGGSCGSPIVENADIYVGLDSSMRRSHHYPWNDGSEVVNVYFPITDGHPPKDVVEFKKMIKWLAVQLVAGKLIHVGCIGGHGRTGLVLAALVKEVTGEEDAITYVRDNYCTKAVESTNQVMFLHNEYGIKKVDASRIVGSAFDQGVGHRYAPGAKWDARTPPQPPQKARKGAGSVIPPVPLSLRPGVVSGRFKVTVAPSAKDIWAHGVVKFDKQAEPDKMELSQEGAN